MSSGCMADVAHMQHKNSVLALEARLTGVIMQGLVHPFGASLQAAFARIVAEPSQGPQAIAKRLRIERLQGQQ